jgi:hypothetical protein
MTERLAQFIVAFVLLTAASLAGAASLDDLEKQIYEGEAKDTVLHQMEFVSEAFRQGELDRGKVVLDDALENISSLYADSESALAARSKWKEEGSKEFKGEPYERTMLYYYRGLMDLWEGQYDNAGASFRGGLLQDAFAEDDQYRSDFLVLMLLNVWATRLIDSYLADEAYDEFIKFKHDEIPDDFIPDPKTHSLILIETGASPRKLLDGVGGYQLVYRAGKKRKWPGVARKAYDNAASISLAGSTYDSVPVEDLYYQAATRGGRAVDKMIEGKASFKGNFTRVGSAMADIGTYASQVSQVASGFELSAGQAAGSMSFNTDAAHGVAIVGAAVLMIASHVKTKADDRYWSGLPDAVSAVFVPKLNGDEQIEVQVKNRETGQILKTDQVRLFNSPQGDVFGWYRSNPD